jgi:hypothetical protein
MEREEKAFPFPTFSFIDHAYRGAYDATIIFTQRHAIIIFKISFREGR